jgi:hypothetical protein
MSTPDSIQHLPAMDDEQILRTSQLGVRFPDGTVVWAPANVSDPIVNVDGSAYAINPRLDYRYNQGSQYTFSQLVKSHREKRKRLGLSTGTDTDPVRVTRNILVVLDAATVTKWEDPA